MKRYILFVIPIVLTLMVSVATGGLAFAQLNLLNNLLPEGGIQMQNAMSRIRNLHVILRHVFNAIVKPVSNNKMIEKRRMKERRFYGTCVQRNHSYTV